MVNRAVRGDADKAPTPQPVDSAPAVAPKPVAAAPAAPAGPPPRPGRAGATAKPVATPPKVAAQPDREIVPIPAAPASAGPPPRPGRSPAAVAAAAPLVKEKCPKCGGDGKYVYTDKRSFSSRIACECVGGGLLKKKS